MSMIDQELDEQKKNNKVRERELLKAQLLAANNTVQVAQVVETPSVKEKESKVRIADVRPLQISTHYTEDDKDKLSLVAMNIRKNSEIKNPRNEEIVHAAVTHFLALSLDEQIQLLREEKKQLGREY